MEKVPLLITELTNWLLLLIVLTSKSKTIIVSVLFFKNNTPHVSSRNNIFSPFGESLTNNNKKSQSSASSLNTKKRQGSGFIKKDSLPLYKYKTHCLHSQVVYGKPGRLSKHIIEIYEKDRFYIIFLDSNNGSIIWSREKATKFLQKFISFLTNIKNNIPFLYRMGFF